jgi:hypothetical protein
MMLRRGLGHGRSITVLASDISKESLARARQGRYPESAMKSVPRAYREYFPEHEEGGVQIHPRIRRLVEFEERNLSTPSYPKGFDLIFCRNVLIYFTPEAKGEAVRRLVNSLAPGGFLFLGYSESLRDVPGLATVRRGETLVYQRQEPEARQRPKPRTSAPPRPAQRRRETRAPLTPGPAAPVASTKVVRLSGDYHDAQRLAVELRAALAESPRKLSVHLDGATFLGEEAATILRRVANTARSMKVSLQLIASRAGSQRFLRRYQLSQLSAEEDER